MSKEMTKDQLLEKTQELLAKIDELEGKLARKDSTVKTRVLELIETGFNSIEKISAELGITAKNVSSNLTHIRTELAKSGKTIISHRIENETKLAIVELSIFG